MAQYARKKVRVIRVNEGESVSVEWFDRWIKFVKCWKKAHRRAKGGWRRFGTFQIDVRHLEGVCSSASRYLDGILFFDILCCFPRCSGTQAVSF